MIHTIRFNAENTFTDHTGVSFVKNPGQPSEETAVPALAAPLFLTDETSPSDILSYNNVEWVTDPVAGDKVEFRYSGGNYEDADGEAMDSQDFQLTNCLDVPIPAGLPVSASLSATNSLIYSFDLQQTLNAPLNLALPELNTERF